MSADRSENSAGNAHIILDKVCVDYPVYDAGNRSLRNALLKTVGGRIASDHGSILVKALDSVSLTLNEGDRLGIVGHNGAGKSTLLKVMSRIYTPTAGRAEIKGTISSLVDIMMGMDMDSTGYENILIRGTLTGWAPSEIRERAAEIAEFTELDDYLHLPIRTYSTGMLVRLAFAVSTARMPDILIMDEMVGAADAAFSKKAQDRIAGFIERSRIVVFASHSTSLLQRFCTRGIFLERGVIRDEGPIDEILGAYAASQGLPPSSADDKTT